MGRRHNLTITEKSKIDVLHERGLASRDIAKSIHRHRGTVSAYLRQAQLPKVKKPLGKPPPLTKRTKRALCVEKVRRVE